LTDRFTALNLSAGIASVTVAVLLVALKLWALVATGALSIAASMTDNALDLMVSIGALAAIAYAARPADDDHTFGHTSAEDLATLLQAALVLTSAGMIGVLAGKRLLSGQPSEIAAQSEGVAVMLVSVLLTGGLIVWQRYVARCTGNRVVAADSLHYLSDLLPTLGVLLALTTSSVWGFDQIDSVVALAAALWMAFSGLRIGRGAWDALMDHAAAPEVIARIDGIAGNWPGVLAFHDLKTRTAGSRTFVSLHLELDGAMTLNAAHAIADGLEHRLEDEIPDAEVIIHLDPVGPGSGREPRG
jgi:ferrous-iron efflux pump FieF